MPEKQEETIRELTLMLMYLTSWEERDTPEMRPIGFVVLKPKE